MTNSNQTHEQTLFIPAVLALLFILIAAGAVWVSQLRPTPTPAAAESVTANTASVSTSTENQVANGDATAGQQLFSATCAACHGPSGEGVQGLGKPLTTSEFSAGLSDDQLVDFVKAGRDPSDPLNTTGIGMPPKGGNPALSDDDLYDIVAFIRSIHE